MDANIRHEIFESLCYAIGAFASLRHACFCIRSIEGQTKVNNSTGDLNNKLNIELNNEHSE